MVIPACAGLADGSVLHRTGKGSAWRALVIQVFVPLTTKWSSFRRAVVRMPCKSEPASGSVRAIPVRRSPVARPGRYRCFCSAVP